MLLIFTRLSLRKHSSTLSPASNSESLDLWSQSLDEREPASGLVDSGHAVQSPSTGCAGSKDVIYACVKRIYGRRINSPRVVRTVSFVTSTRSYYAARRAIEGPTLPCFGIRVYPRKFRQVTRICSSPRDNPVARVILRGPALNVRYFGTPL